MNDFAKLIADANARYAAMTPKQQAAMWQAQRESFARGMQPCEHGVADFEQCPACRGEHQPKEQS